MGSCQSKFPTVRVAVIGGGYTGTAIARKLDEQFDVTVIEKRDRFYHSVAGPRILVEGIEDSVFIPYTHLLKRGRVMQGEAVDVLPDSHTVVVRAPTGATIDVPYDYLVIATGSNVPIPFRAATNDAVTSKARLRELREAVTGATSVTLVGGGPVGVEVAGEIRTDHPTKPVHLVHAHGELLSAARNGPILPPTRARVRAGLEAAGVTLHLKTRAERPNPTTLPPGVREFAPGVFIGPLPLRLSDGSTLTSDVTIFTTSGSTGTPPLPPHLRDGFNERGSVKVMPTLQMEGHSDIFAIGDVTDIEEPKTLILGVYKHVPVVVANITSLARARAAAARGASGVTPPVLKRHLTPGSGMMAIPIGRRGGVTQLGNLVLGGWVTATIKSGSYMVPQANSSMGYPTPGVYPDAAGASASAGAGSSKGAEATGGTTKLVEQTDSTSKAALLS